MFHVMIGYLSKLIQSHTALLIDHWVTHKLAFETTLLPNLLILRADIS